MADRPKWLRLFSRKDKSTNSGVEAPTAPVRSGTSSARRDQAPTIYGMMHKYNQRGVHELEDLLDFGMLTPDEARVMRRQLGRPEPEAK